MGRKDARESLRGKASRHLGRRVPADVMESVKQDTVDLVEAGEVYAFEDAIGEIKTLLTVYEKGRRTPSRTRMRQAKFKAQEDTVRRLLDDAERLRSEVLTEHFASLADQLPEVVAFRKEALGGETLSDSEAEELVGTPAYRYLSREQIQSAAMPLRGLRSYQRTRVYVHDLPNGDPITLREVRLECTWGNGHRREEVVNVPLLDYPNSPMRMLHWEDKTGTPEDIPVLPDSSLDALRRVSESVSWRLWWPESKASRFVLTGKFPISPAIDITTSQRKSDQLTQGRIVLTIAPWVSAKSVAAVYSHFQKVMVGRNSRALDAKSLELFRFIEGKKSSGARTQTWPELLRLWRSNNRRAAQRGYRRLQRDYVRTQDALTRPIYAMGAPLRPILETERIMRRFRRTKNGPKRLALMNQIYRLRSKSETARSKADGG